MAEPSPAPIWNDTEARFYAEGLAQSDYGPAVGGALHRRFGSCDSLLDIGAGCGLLGALLLAPGGRWTALEPNAYMRSALLARAAQLERVTATALAIRWEAVDGAGLDRHEIGLCANVGLLTHHQPLELRASLRPLVRRLAWVVSAQHGPRTFCLSGLLPEALHRQDTRPGYLYTLERLGAAQAPDAVELIDWTFRYAFADHGAARAHFAARLGAPDLDRAGTTLDGVLRERLRMVDGRYVAEAPKRSALLIWER